MRQNKPNCIHLNKDRTCAKLCPSFWPHVRTCQLIIDRDKHKCEWQEKHKKPELKSVDLKDLDSVRHVKEYLDDEIEQQLDRVQRNSGSIDIVIEVGKKLEKLATQREFLKYLTQL